MTNLKLFFKRLIPSNKKGWSVFAGCLLTASIFWLVLTFSRNFETVLNFKVNYTSKLADKTIVNQPIEALKVKVKGRGFDLFRYTIFDKQEEISFDLSDFKAYKKGSLYHYYLPLNEKTPVGIAEKKWDFKILSYSNDTLFLSFDELISKKVKVVPVYHLNIDTTSIMVRGVEVQPDSIEIIGGKSELNTIHFVKTKPFVLENVNHPISIKLESQEKNVKSNCDSVKVRVEFEKISQHKISVPVVCASCPEELNIKLFPSSADLLFSCTNAQFSNLSSQQFKVEVQYGDIQKGMEKISINLVSFPSEVKNLKVSPAKAEYLIRQQ